MIRPHVIVCGSRTLTDAGLVEEKLNKMLVWLKDPIIMHGCSEGADMLAEGYCMRKYITYMRFPAPWKDKGKAAGPIRNEEMAKFAAENPPSYCIAFRMAGKSPGTDDMIERCRKYGIETRVIKIKR